ncbi:MAG: hypothetical protein HY366_00415 [Candidatus Aenigmarchaeota archaeon]|nr:hypothetical protein [Candidatus Aenigmarchaeota archaeon]
MMVNEGTLFSGVMLIAAAATFFISIYTGRNRWQDVLSPTTIRMGMVFWLVAGLSALLTGTRQLFAYFGLYEIDKAIFIFGGIPSSLLVAPAIGMVVFILSGNKTKASVSTTLFALFAFGVFVASAAGGIAGPQVTYWGTGYVLSNELAKTMLLLGIFVPGIAASSIMLLFGKYSGSSASESSLTYSALAMAILISALSLEMIVGGGNAELLLSFRGLVALSAFLVFKAYVSGTTARLSPRSSARNTPLRSA